MGENISKNKQWGREDFSALKRCKKSVKNEKIGDNFQILCYNSRVYARYIVSVRVLNSYRISIYRQNDKGE